MSSTKLATKSITHARPTAWDKTTPVVRDTPSTPPVERAYECAPRRKTTAHVELRSATDVRAALNHAIHIGLPPNRHLTIDIEAAGAADPIASIGKFLKLLRDAARRHEAQVSYVWVRETGPIVGDHVHILLHVPAIPEWFARRKPRWLKLSGLSPVRGGSRTRIIRGCAQSDAGDLTSPALFRANLKTLEKYLLKHCSKEVQTALGVHSRGPCLVVGKRVSISQNLHRAARSRCVLCDESLPILSKAYGA